LFNILIIDTLPPINITDTSVTLRGEVLFVPNDLPTRYIKWGSSIDMPNEENLGEGGEGIFSIEITDLDPSKTYYYQAFAVDEEGTEYGSMVSFITNPGFSVVSVMDVREMEGVY